MASKAPGKDLVVDIVERLRKAMKKANLKAVDLARQSGVDAPAISRLLNYQEGDRGLETTRLFAVLEAACRRDVSLDYVFTGQGAPLRTLVLAENEHFVATASAAAARALETVVAKTVAGSATAQTDDERSGERPPARAKRR